MKNMKKLDRAALITAALITVMFLVGLALLAASPLSPRHPTRRELDRSMVVLFVAAALFVAAWAFVCWLITKGVKLYYEVKNTSDDSGDLITHDSNADPEEVKIEGNEPAGLQISDDSDDLTEIVIEDTNEGVHDAATLPTEVQAGGNKRGIRKKLAECLHRPRSLRSAMKKRLSNMRRDQRPPRRLILELAKELDILEDQTPDDSADDPDEIVVIICPSPESKRLPS